MCETCTHIIQVNASLLKKEGYDPTRTTTLRNLFARESDRRFNTLIKDIVHRVVNTEFFAPSISTFQKPTPNYDFPIDPNKLNSFLQWLEEQVNKGILNGWPNKYISEAYKRGVLRAITEMRKAKYSVPTIMEQGGISNVMRLPYHISTLELLYLRVFENLKGITAQMQQVIIKVLLEGFTNKESYAVIAEKLVAVTNGAKLGELGIFDKLGRFIPARRRAELLARTEIVRANHLAMINEYRRWGVTGVIVLAEFQTAGDERVCSICASMEGNLYTLDEAEGLIPVHPLCRCIILPIIKEER
jgi:SPP1 gp7 family putative phage head morphogenesis protein